MDHVPADDGGRFAEIAAEAAWVRRLALALAADAHSGEDIAQDALAAAAARRPGELRDLRSWFRRVVSNLARRRACAQLERSAREQRAARLEATEDSSLALERLETIEILASAVRTLAEPYRTTVLQRWYEGISPEEISQRTNTPVRTVHTRTSRALALLREELERRSRGGPSRWLAAWIPLLPKPNATSPWVVSMSLKSKLALAGLAVLLLFAGWFVVGARRTEEPLAVAPAPDSLAADGSPSDSRATLVTPAANGNLPRAALPVASKATSGSLLVQLVWGDDHSPAAGVSLTLFRHGADPLFEQPQSSSDEHGSARFTELAPGQVFVQLHRGDDGWGDEVAIVAGKEATRTITIVNGLRCTGRVLDAQDRPVADAELLVAAGNGGEAWPLARTNSDGGFELRCLATNCCIGARKAGLAPSDLREFSSTEGAHVECTLVLGPAAARLAGIVLDPAQQPVPGAVVQAGHDDFAEEQLPDGTTARLPMPERVRTDAQGRFRFQSLLPGSVPISVRARALAPWHAMLECEPGREEQLTVQLEAGVTLLGTLHDASGAPAPRAEVHLGEWDDLGYRSVQSDEQGAYRIEGAGTGQLRLSAEHDSLGRAKTMLQASAGQTLRWDAVLSKGLVLEGRLLDAEEQPVAGAQIQGRLERADKYDDWASNARTDKQGRFQLENCDVLRPICVHVTGKSAFPLLSVHEILPGPEELVLRLPKEAWAEIQGRILDPEDKPLPNVHVSLAMTGVEGWDEPALDPASGAFHCTSIPPGEYQLTFETAGYPKIRLPKRTLGPAATWDVGTLHFRKGGSLLVDLQRADRKPASAHMPLQLCDTAGGPVEQIDVRNGTGRAGPLAPGSYVLQVTGKGIAAQQQQLEVKAGVELRVDVLAQPGLPVEIECRMPANVRGGTETQLVIRDAAGGTVFSGTGEGQDGTSRLELALLAGTYRVEAMRDALHGSATLKVEAGSGPSTVVVTLGQVEAGKH